MEKHLAGSSGPRAGADRRLNSLPWWHLRRLRGRRVRMRRDADQERPYFVDRVPGSFLIAASLLLVLTLVDGVVTILLLDHGFEEANPIMALLLEQGQSAFLLGKYVLTACFLPIALVMNRYRLFGTRVRVGHFLPVAMALYVALIVYQAVLWEQLPRRRPEHRIADPLKEVPRGILRRENHP